MEWLKQTRCQRKPKYDFSIIKKCLILMLCNIFIALVSIVVQLIISKTDGLSLSYSGILQEILFETVCSYDFVYINFSILFMLFVENSLLEKERKNSFIDFLAIFWALVSAVAWTIIVTRKTGPNRLLFSVSLWLLALTIIVYIIYTIVRYTNITFVHKERR